ncbi:hypothetical protein [Lacrimispora sp.]|uniref:hypothetical protein n=1 Tax=Lacrimispora sp. TaxID=2719234 RepID=UPI0029E767B7|nr:hypothetical protein [Lacrimispora sp.]
MKRPISIIFVIDLLFYLSLSIVAYAVALAEMLVKFLDGDITGLDYIELRTANERKLSAIISYIASRESVLWLRDYISDTLLGSQENNFELIPPKKAANGECNKNDSPNEV